MHHFIHPCFNKYLSMRNQPGLFHIVNKHWSWWASNFKLRKAVIILYLSRKIHKTPPCFHHIVSCVFFTHKGFTYCLNILIDVKPTQQVSCLREHSFHCIHQCWISVHNSNLRDCITSYKNSSKPFKSPDNIVYTFTLQIGKCNWKCHPGRCNINNVK